MYVISSFFNNIKYLVYVFDELTSVVYLIQEVISARD
jgi:hypothetical protein